MLFIFTKTRGSKGNLNKWGVLFPDAPDSFKLSLKIKY